MWSGCTSCTKCHPLFPEREHCMATLFSRKAYCQLNDGDPPKDIMFSNCLHSTACPQVCAVYTAL